MREKKEIDNLKIVKDKDYVTLITCTPYGINTHRLLVRGVRIDNIEEKVFITTEAFKVSRLTVIPILSIPIIIIIFLIILFKPVINKDKIKNKYIYPKGVKKW